MQVGPQVTVNGAQVPARSSFGVANPATGPWGLEEFTQLPAIRRPQEVR